jgi:hypothetical protein
MIGRKEEKKEKKRKFGQEKKSRRVRKEMSSKGGRQHHPASAVVPDDGRKGVRQGGMPKDGCGVASKLNETQVGGRSLISKYREI